MLSNLFRDKLQQIVNDDLLIQAVKAVFDERAEMMKPGADVPNSELGEKYRAYLTARDLIDKSFIDLASYKLPLRPNKDFNKER